MCCEHGYNAHREWKTSHSMSLATINFNTPNKQHPVYGGSKTLLYTLLHNPCSFHVDKISPNKLTMHCGTMLCRPLSPDLLAHLDEIDDVCNV